MAISFDNPVVTHRVTYIPDGDQYLFCVIDDKYCWKHLNGDWRKGPFESFNYYVRHREWKVEKINKFKGNV